MFQEKPGYKLKGVFRIDDVLLKKGGDSNSYAVAKSKHWLINQEDKVVLLLEYFSLITVLLELHAAAKNMILKIHPY